jgi:hypothetical protein
MNNINQVMAYINQQPTIFKSHYSEYQCFELLATAVKAYNNVYDYSIRCPADLLYVFNYLHIHSSKQPVTPKIATDDDISRVTKSYDRVAEMGRTKTKINDAIMRIIKDKDAFFCPEIIIGEGDTGTTLWLEKFTKEHRQFKTNLAQGKLPAVLMISDGTGSWKHDYTLAQPQNILERAVTKSNPSDFMSRKFYWANPYANGRHVYQANQLSLAKTEAPRLFATVEKIEKKSNHPDKWQMPDCDYRLLIKTQNGVKRVYTNKINICTGLGPARVDLKGGGIQADLFKQLSQFDVKKRFTPIVDGNQFILTGSEEQCHGKTVVVYGGGGTAAAVYRKAFHGHDRKTESLGFQKENQKNQVVWIAKQFNKAGTGKLASSALNSSLQRKERFEGALMGIDYQSDKLLLTFTVETPSQNKETIQCDQFVYSIGQDDKTMRQVCEEIDTDLKLELDSVGMPLVVSSSDKQICFFGAAAMAVRESEYMEYTWKWLKKENIQGDVGPGSMPPSRAQIKKYLSLHGISPKCINVNIDSSELMVEYLDKLGVDRHTAQLFVGEVLANRSHSTSGGTRLMLSNLVGRYQLEAYVRIYGHGHLVAKTSVLPLMDPVEVLPKLSLFKNSSSTNDSLMYLSSVSLAPVQKKDAIDLTPTPLVEDQYKV